MPTVRCLCRLLSAPVLTSWAYLHCLHSLVTRLETGTLPDALFELPFFWGQYWTHQLFILSMPSYFSGLPGYPEAVGAWNYMTSSHSPMFITVSLSLWYHDSRWFAGKMRALGEPFQLSACVSVTWPADCSRHTNSPPWVNLQRPSTSSGQFC